MAVKPIAHVQSAEPPSTQEATPLQDLLRQPAKHPVASAMSSIVLGRILSLNESGQAQIALPSASAQPLLALSLCQIAKEHIGRTCAVQFIDGDPTQPLIIGLIQDSPGFELRRDVALPAVLTISQNGERVQIDAVEELVLQCGEASIVMSAEGLIEIRAPYIDNHALATQRIRGGSVRVN